MDPENRATAFGEKGSPAVVLFDATCNLCNRIVDIIIRYDRARVFRFAALSSEVAKAFLQKCDLPLEGGTVVLVENGKCYTESTAALRILRRMDRAWPLLYGFVIIPPFIRNAVYRLISHKRHDWFGCRAAPREPEPEIRDRFIG